MLKRRFKFKEMPVPNLGHGRGATGTAAPSIAASVALAMLTGACSTVDGQTGAPALNTTTSPLPCPDSPNCVSSTEREPSRWVAPLALGNASIDSAQSILAHVIETMPDANIVSRQPGELKAEFRSKIFGFVDDVVIVFDAGADVAHIRSASRVGYWDLGANRRRVEAIRSAFAAELGAPQRPGHSDASN